MWRPSEAHDALLRAALLEGDAFHAAFRRWSERVDLDSVDGPSQRLFPLLFKNAARHGLAGPVVDTLKRHQLIAWVRNERLLRATQPLLHRLDREGVEWLLLKGAGIAPRYYRDLSERPMNDLDLLVHPADVARARGALAAEGFHSVYDSERRTDDVLSIVHSCGFRRSDGVEVDLHRHALLVCCDERFDDALWRNAEPCALPLHAARTLGATDHLLHAIVHARMSELYNRQPSLQWAADAMALLRRGAVDFERILQVAETWQLAMPIASSLRYLAARLDAPIEASVLTRLSALQPSPIERFERLTDSIASPNLQRIGTFVGTYLRLRRGRHDDGAPMDLGTYLRHAWGLDSSQPVVPTLGKKLAANAVRIGRFYTASVRARAQEADR